MLVLSRRVNERITIGPDVVITVVRIGAEKVRLGIEAPPDVLVLREELLAPGELDRCEVREHDAAA